MPFVNVKVAGPLSGEQKTELAARIAAALEDIAHKPKQHTQVVFDEVSRDNWAVGGDLLSTLDKKQPR